MASLHMLLKACDTGTSTREWFQLNFTSIPTSILAPKFVKSVTKVKPAICQMCAGAGVQDCYECEGKGVDDDGDQCWNCMDEEGMPPGKTPCPEYKCSAATGQIKFDSLFSESHFIYRVNDSPSPQLLDVLPSMGFATFEIKHKHDYTWDTYHVYQAQIWQKEVANHTYLLPIAEKSESYAVNGYGVSYWAPVRATVARKVCEESGHNKIWTAIHAKLLGEIKYADSTFLPLFKKQFPLLKKETVKAKDIKAKTQKPLKNKKASKKKYKIPTTVPSYDYDDDTAF